MDILVVYPGVLVFFQLTCIIYPAQHKSKENAIGIRQLQNYLMLGWLGHGYHKLNNFAIG